jgi:hypothetical protein
MDTPALSATSFMVAILDLLVIVYVIVYFNYNRKEPPSQIALALTLPTSVCRGVA